MDVALSIEHLLPEAEYGGTTEENTQAEFDDLRWEDSRPKPTWSQIEAAWATIGPSFLPRRRKQFQPLLTELKSLSPLDRNKIQMAVMVEFLAEHPQFAKEKLGINIEGDELEP